MSLLLCRQEPVENPYYMEVLGIHLYSSQELSYVIYHYPLLVMENFLDDRLIGFIRRELRMPFLAERMEKWLDTRGESDELLFQILLDCGYYSPQEQTKFRQEVAGLRKLSGEEYEKKRADYYYQLGLFGQAVAMYEKILESGREKGLSGALKGRIWNNIAACYGKLFCYQKAMHAYDCAWAEDGDPDHIRRMYFLTLMKPELEIKEKYLEKMTAQEKAAWDLEYQVLLEEGGEPDSMEEIRRIFDKDPLKRIAEAAQLLNRWKVEYRKMV